MAIAYDATSRSGNGWSTNTSSLTFSHTITGSNTFLAVGTGTYNTAARSVSGVTYNGVACTKANAITATLEGVNQDTELWYLDGPATGANNIVVTLSAVTEFAQSIATSYTGKTSSGIDANATSQDTSGSTASPACNVTVVASDCWLVSFAYSRRAESPTAGTATTVRNTGASGHAQGDSNAVVGTGSQTLAFSTAVSGTWPGVCSLSFSAGGGGGGAAIRVFFPYGMDGTGGGLTGQNRIH